MTLLNEAQEEQLKEISTHLRQVRQEKSLSIDDIAAKTLIRPAFLQALEEWQFAELPEPVYIQGFIRRYADALGLDGTALADRLAINVIPRNFNNVSHNVHIKPDIKIYLSVVYILLLVAAAVGLLNILNPKLITESLAPKPKVIPSPLASLTVPSPSVTNISAVEVTLELQGDSWLQVKADGNTQFEGILTKGERKTWRAKKQLTVRSGNAGVVLVSVNQQQPKPLGDEGKVKEVIYTPDANSQ